MSVVGGHYGIDQVERLARAGRIVSTKRVAQWLSNHGYDVRETLVDVLTWYLKFWVDEDHLVVDVWSCCWDGVVH